MIVHMNLSHAIKKFGLVKPVLDQGGSIHPLIIPAEHTNGTGLMNPSIYVDNGKLLLNIRHVNYTLYHSENKKFQHRYGPLQYLHPENDRNLRTWNFYCTVNDDLSLDKIIKIDTSTLDAPPIWEFVGLEDGRLFRWDNKLFLSGVRRDTTTNGQGRMELSELQVGDNTVSLVLINNSLSSMIQACALPPCTSNDLARSGGIPSINPMSKPSLFGSSVFVIIGTVACGPIPGTRRSNL